ncbi:MAG: YceI family protein [Pseudomonadota bacterium]
MTIQTIQLWQLLRRFLCQFFVFSLFGFGAANAHDLNLQFGWRVDSDASDVSFTMVKKGTVVEFGTFSGLSGSVDANGTAELQLDMQSVSSGFDIRDVRLRFLLFEVQKFPNALIQMQINSNALDGIRDGDMRDITQDLRVNFRGKFKTYTADLRVHAMDDDLVSVTLKKPILINAADFDLAAGFRKLEEAVQVTIVPATSLSFNIVLRQNSESS